MLRKKYQNISHFCLWLAILGAAQLDAQLPTGASIASGAASIHQNGSAMTINQSSQKAALNWQSFNIGAGNSVNFIQPNASSVALNRVLGNDASSIFGSLSANGSVFLLNPNGVLFAPGAQVNVGGLVASTLSLSDADFAAGNYLFTNNGGAGSVINQGHIQAGNVALLGPQIVNSGLIDASGSVALAAGDTITVKLLDSGLLTAHVEKAALAASIQNHGQILANGGQVQLSADAIQDSLINTDGLIQARSLVNKEGHIYLSGGSNGTVTVSGTLDASGAEAGAHGGDISVLGQRVTLGSGSEVDVSGQRSGGTALIGGDYQGKNPEVLNARVTTVESGASIRADGAEQGGRVIVWSNNTTRFEGEISARGQGFAEVSGKGTLGFSGKVDTGGGTLLLDPTNITVQNTNGDGTNTLSGGQINTLLLSNDVTLAADNNITWNANATLDYNGIGSTGRTLTLQAGNTISYSGSILDSVTGGDKLNVVFNADRDASGAGGISVNNGSSIFTSGGDITLRGGNAALAPLPAFTDPNYETSLRATAARGVSLGSATLDAGGGNITMRGVGVDGTSSGMGVLVGTGVVRTSGAGAITIDGIGGAGNDYNRGVYMSGASVSTVDGALTVQGMANGTGIENIGVRFDNSTLQVTGSGATTINGLGSTGANTNDGIVFAGATTLSVNNGDVTITGTGRGTGSGSDGIELANGTIVEATGAGNVILKGTSTATGANTDRGVVVWLGSTVRTTNSALTLQGASVNTAAGNGISLEGATSTIGGTSQSGPMTLTADTMNFAAGTIQGSGSLLVQPLTPTTAIGLGNGAAGTLNLTSSELARLTDGFSSITIGRTDSSGAVDVRTAPFLDPITIRTPAGSGSIAVSGAISTPNALTLTAGNSYTFTGTSALNSDTLAFGNTNGITNTGTLTLSQSADITIANIISGSNGNLVKTGTNTLTLTGNNTYTGTTTISAGTLQVGSGSTSGMLGSGAVSDNGMLTFNRSDALGISNTISGTGNLVKNGAGAITLSGSNTYSGTTTVNAGTLAVTNPSGLGDTSGGTTVAAGATLDLQNVAVSAESLTLAAGILSASTGTSSLSGPITLAGVTPSFFNIAGGAELDLSGIISGGGGLSKVAPGTGTLVLAGANTYTGPTYIYAGTLAITNDSALGSTGPGNFTNLLTGSTLDLRNVTTPESFSPNGGGILVSSGASTILANMGAFTSLPINVLNGAQLTMAGVINISTPLIKNGGGTLTLTGNNTNAGATTISAGTVQVGNGGATGKFGTGAVTVANGANLVFNRSDSVSLSTLASNAAGISGAGNVSALIGGGFIVDRPITLTGPNSNILLEAGKNQLAGDVSGGDVTLSSLISTSATGTVTISSGHANTAALDAQVSGATGATRYKSYGASASSTSSAVAGTRNYYYREQPAPLSVSGLTATKTYDGLLEAAGVLDGSTAAVNGLIDGDVLSYSSLSLTGANFDSAHAGTRSVNATFTGATPAYSGGGATWSISGYGATNLSTSFAGTVTPKALTTSINAVGKIYDGLTTTASTLTAPVGWIGNDSVAGVSGLLLAFDDPNAGTRNVVASGTGTITGFSGAARGNGSGIGAGNEVAGLAGDYSIPTPAPASAVIGQAPLTITANNDAKIVTQSDTPGYNGASYAGFVHGETEANLGGSLSLTRSNAGTEGAGNYAGVLAPSGYSSSNYAINYANGDYQILPAQQLLVKIHNITDPYGTSPAYVVNSVQYLDTGGTAVHALTETAHSANTYTYADGIGGSVTFTITPQGTVTSNAGYLAVGNYTLSGSNASITGNNFLGLNYVGNQSVRQIGLTLLADGTSKVYDGTTAIPRLSMDVAGKLSGDVLLAAGDGAFRTKNAGSNLGYDVNNITLSGADAGNYYLATGGFSGTNGQITPRTITANVTANNKVYDGSTAATLTAAGLNGVIAGDALALDAANYSAFFSDRNVGSNKAVTLSGLGLSGADAGNYTLTQPSGLTADITPRQLTVTAVENTKTYDGTTQAAAAPQVSGWLGTGDRFTMLAENYTNANAGTGRTLVPVVSIDDGNGGNNYTLTLSHANGAINQAALLLAPNAVRVPYTGLALNNTAYSDLLSNYTLTGLLGGDTLSSIGLSLTGSMAFNGSTTALVQNPGAYLFGAGTLSPSLTNTNYTIAFANPSGNAYAILPGFDSNSITAATIASSDASNIRSQMDAAHQQLGTEPSEPKCLLALEGGSMKLPEGVSDNSQAQQQRACRGNR